MAAFADDLAWLCSELGVIKPIVVGHSMGGNVALLDDRYSSLVRSESRLRFALNRRQERRRDIAGLRPYSPKLLS